MSVSIETPVFVTLGSIDPNPYQPREGEDAEHIKALAISIAESGLLQIPQGRLIGSEGQIVEEARKYNTDYGLEQAITYNGYRVQLAFGHSRLAAFKFLTDAGNAGFETMPVVIRDLTDAEMFNLAISENLQRKDLTPIEEAQAMRRARDEFGMTSAQIGSLFGLSDSAVRNKMRLVELPAAVQEQLKAGALPEGTARRLLPLAWMGEEKVVKLAVDLAADPDKTPGTIDYRITEAIGKNAQLLYRGWQEDQKKVDDLWPLDWRPGFDLPMPDFKKEFLLTYQGPVHFTLRTGDNPLPYEMTLESAFNKICFQWNEPFLEAHVQNMGAEAVMGAIRFWVNPPACESCPFFVRANHAGYCGMKACYQRKKVAWIQSEAARVAKKYGLVVYDPAKDGDQYEECPDQWGLEYGDWGRLIMSGDANIRVMPLKRSVYVGNKSLSYSGWVTFVSIAPEAIQRANERKARVINRQDADREREATQLLHWRNARKSDRLIELLAGPFADLWFSRWSQGAWNVFVRKDGTTSKLEYTFMRLRNFCSPDTKIAGPEETLKWLRGLAKEAGVVLQADTDQVLAEVMEMEVV